MRPSTVFKDFLIIICILATVNSFAAPETVEVPEDAENYYSEEISSNDLEPEVTIIKRKDSVKEEYRLNGKLYMVKIIPSVGPAYYYIDQDGDGVWETRNTDRNSTSRVPQWVILNW